MSNPPTIHDSDRGDEWETYVQNTARAFVYPPTPNISHSLAPASPGGLARWRLVWIVLALLILGALMAVPDVRASVLKVLRIGGIEIVIDEPTSVPVTVTPPAVSIPGAPRLTLDGETTLEAARREVNFVIRVPADLGSPDRVFLQDIEGPLVILVWTAPGDPSRIEISLHILGPGVRAMKSEPELIQETEVNGRRALWTVGSHMLKYQTKDGITHWDIRELVEGHVLMWEEDQLTYRLESDLSLEEAIHIAESLQGGSG
jgi:hypothetical protein